MGYGISKQTEIYLHKSAILFLMNNGIFARLVIIFLVYTKNVSAIYNNITLRGDWSFLLKKNDSSKPKFTVLLFSFPLPAMFPLNIKELSHGCYMNSTINLLLKGSAHSVLVSYWNFCMSKTKFPKQNDDEEIPT